LTSEGVPRILTRLRKAALTLFSHSSGEPTKAKKEGQLSLASNLAGRYTLSGARLQTCAKLRNYGEITVTGNYGGNCGDSAFN
jgi:hypothetical protein